MYLATMTTNNNSVVASNCSCLEFETDYVPTNTTFNQTEKQTKEDCDEITRILRLLGENPDVVCPPNDYGIGCKAHDLEVNKQCQDGDKQNIPDYCYRKWCYVDKESCFSTDVVLYGDEYLEGTFYTSDFCERNTDTNTLQKLYKDRSSVAGKVLQVIIPNEVYPFHFKDPNHPNYHEYESFDNTEYRGIIIEYLELIVEKTPIAGFEYAERSGGALRRTFRYPGIKNSTYTSAVIDVQARLGHLAAGAYWVTSERLMFAAFTIPIHVSDFYLFELERQGFDLLYSIEKTLKPFDKMLWVVLIFCIILFGITNVMSSNARGDRAKWHDSFRSIRWNTSTKFKRYKIGSKTYLEGIIMAFVEYFGNASEMNAESTISHKVLVFGFGFFILILTASYTANLASFLSAPKVGDYVDDLDEAIKENKKICFEDMLEETILSNYPESKYPKIKSLLRPLKFPRETYFVNATQKLQNHECDVFIGEVVQLEFLSDDVSNQFCDSGVRSFGIPILQMEWALPIDPHYDADFSQAILALAQEGTDISDLIQAYTHGTKCDVFIRRTGVDNAQLGINQLFFPFFILMICICIGSLWRVDTNCFYKNSSVVEKRSEDDIFDNEMDEKDKSTESENSLADALEYKYRLDLVQLNVKKLQQEMSIFCRDLEDSKIK